ncbi:DUF4230 domain-containing protein [Trichococcus sp. K1Tr]|uniref:DUF4230 domain-containing protein n=1 Tax=Trichococcus sp. K1Tr TaxID=3020847 RepID=UPI0023315613|nr:DUF4230 domain-containing protein [Trichococcus sp. K1Tr]MDB6352177.1 DUF4230 domain-containing protein [Trichococcus sp. K1Tr]
MKKLKVFLVSMLSIWSIGTVGFLMLNKTEIFAIQTNKSSEAALTQEKLVELSELATLKYEYSNVIISRTDRSISVPVFPDFNFAEAIRLIEYSGYLKAGTDFSKVQQTYDEVSEILLVKVPKSYILDNVVETEKMTVEDVKGNIFSDYPTQIIIDEINADKKQLEEEKISQGFLDEADKRAELLLHSHYSSNGYEDIKIEFY